MCERRHTHLHHAADHHRQHVERETQDVEERQRHEGLLSVQHVVFIHQHVDGEGGQGDLHTEGRSSVRRQDVFMSRTLLPTSEEQKNMFSLRKNARNTQFIRARTWKTRNDRQISYFFR